MSAAPDETPLHELSIAEAGARLRAGTLTATALARHALARIKAIDPLVNAFVLLTEERALADADAADAALAAGQDGGPLHGIPIGLKDIYDTAGIRTTCHSRLLLENVPAEDSVVAAKLRAGGAVLLGKLGTYEFAIGGPSFDLPFPPARNPWNPEYITGGSSSGSAAAVAAGLTRMAMGSDTGGSIRGPAAYCGIVGLKPSYGLVSRRGVFPLAYALDHCGPLARSVEDAALTLQVIAGHDPLDPASAAVRLPDLRARLQAGVDGLVLGVPRHFFATVAAASPELIAALDAAAQTLARLGARVEEIALPDYALFNACGRIILTAEAFAVHEADLRDRPLEYGRYFYQRVAPGAAITVADLVQAQRLRRELASAVNRVLRHCHALITPTALTGAPRFDAFGPDISPWLPIQTMPFNVTGHPALSVPIGFTADGLPLAMQIVGRAFDEATVCRIGAAYERDAGWVTRRPPLAAAVP